jgi:hypothetical protein
MATGPARIGTTVAQTDIRFGGNAYLPLLDILSVLQQESVELSLDGCVRDGFGSR